MKKASIYKNNTAVASDARITSGFIERLRGLMWVKSISDDYGLVIKPCNQIHMFNMRFPLDVIYLSDDNTVLDIDRDIQPWKIGRLIKNASGVIEVNSGFCIRNDINIGDTLTIRESIQ